MHPTFAQVAPDHVCRAVGMFVPTHHAIVVAVRRCSRQQTGFVVEFVLKHIGLNGVVIVHVVLATLARTIGVVGPSSSVVGVHAVLAIHAQGTDEVVFDHFVHFWMQALQTIGFVAAVAQDHFVVFVDVPAQFTNFTFRTTPSQLRHRRQGEPRHHTTFVVTFPTIHTEQRGHSVATPTAAHEANVDPSKIRRERHGPQRQWFVGQWFVGASCLVGGGGGGGGGLGQG
jgi:hypothetical protein